MKTYSSANLASSSLVFAVVALALIALPTPRLSMADDPNEAEGVPVEAAYSQHVRLRILKVTPVEVVDQTRILKLDVERAYGKIDAKSLHRAKKHETQQFSLLFPAAIGADIRAGDLINYKLAGYATMGRND
jgi:hypothetical protein